MFALHNENRLMPSSYVATMLAPGATWDCLFQEWREAMVQNTGQTGFTAKHQFGGCVGDKAIQSLELSGTGSAFSSLQVLCEGVTAFVLAL
jgi:hypothetical protein